MKKISLVLTATLLSLVGFSQQNMSSESALSQVQITKNVTIGGYAQIDYNEPNGSEPGNLDVHRVVMLLGYKFNEKVSFLTEIEYEHVREEAGIEQVYIKYKISDKANVLAGLMLIPMGIMNEFHEPSTFYGVERPNVDKFIVPTTWRELGIGISGNLTNVSLNYQVYLFNGFKSYANGVGYLNGNGFQGGKQEGMESIINSPNFSAKLDYYGILGLRLGLSGYFGKTQTDDTSIEASTVGVSMIGLDARYKYHNLELRGQYINTNISGTANYNILTGNNLGSRMNGFYTEIAYGFNLKGEEKLTPFVRYENYNTQAQTEGSLVANKAYDVNEIIFGLNYKVAEGAAFKMDYQFINSAVSGSDTGKQFNAGVAVWF
ncbi:MAG: hypothetical protein COC22_06940 [Flavobacteriaceae bacterium]|nr:MAG: hypothetical protein COC22_06940 [Flavobacteriaceae bacterium]